MPVKLHISLRYNRQFQDNSHLSLAVSFFIAMTDMNSCTVSSKSLWASPLKYILNLTIFQTSNCYNPHPTLLTIWISWVSLPPIVLLPLSSWSDLFQHKSDHLCSCAPTAMDPLRPLAKILTKISLLAISHFLLLHMPSCFVVVVLYFLYVLPRILFFQVTAKLSPIPHAGFCSDYHLLVKASLNIILSTSYFPSFSYFLFFFFLFLLCCIFHYGI